MGMFVNQGNLGPFAYNNAKSTQIHNFKTVVFVVIQICLASKKQQEENVAQKWT